MPDPAHSLGRLAELRAAGIRVADEASAKALLRELGLATPRGTVVSGAAAAAEAAARIGFPVVLKMGDPELPHKTELAGVAGPLNSVAEVAASAHDMGSSKRLLVESWEDGGTLCFVGLACRTPFGPLLSFGLGGVWVEALQDVIYTLAPASHREIRALLAQLRGFGVLTGARGRSPVDLDSLAETIAAFSRLAADARALALLDEIDVNPLLVRAGGPPMALDATAVLRRSAAPLMTIDPMPVASPAITEGS
jgi:hypothetical protein